MLFVFYLFCFFKEDEQGLQVNIIFLGGWGTREEGEKNKGSREKEKRNSNTRE